MADLVGCAKDIGKCILTECIQPPAKRHFDYWWCFDDNIKDLKSGIEELKRQKHDIEQKCEEARLLAHILRPGVEEWLEASTEKLEEAQNILVPNHNIPKAWNLISRYSLGKIAKKTAQEIENFRNERNFNPIADPGPTPAMASPCHVLTMEFESRKSIENESRIHKWDDSLIQLRGGNPSDFSEVMSYVYNALKLSYDCLENDTRYVFLMCCLFPEDYEIPIEVLTLYSMGLQLFDDITNIEQARNRTYRLVDKLESVSLLISIKRTYGLFVKMHDVVRDVAIDIVSRKNDGFLKSLQGSSIENPCDVNCNWMSVDFSNEQMEVPLLSRFPKLRLLMLLKLSSNQFSDISFEGMEALNVLSLQSISIRSLPPSMGSLENLRTLRLFCCEVQNISVIGKLTSLTILSCCECKNITELPAEIGRLKGLLLLELNECRNLKRIPFGIISSLCLLEELKIFNSFSEWETGGERKNASLTELESLLNLTCLEIQISDCTLPGQERCLSQQLFRYRICMGLKALPKFSLLPKFVGDGQPK